MKVQFIKNHKSGILEGAIHTVSAEHGERLVKSKHVKILDKDYTGQKAKKQDYSKMKLKALCTLCTEREIPFSDEDDASALIALLEQSDAEA